MTPHQRLAADVRTPDEVRARLQEIYAGLDPVVLLRDIRASQERLAALADVQPVGHTAAAEQPIELFLTKFAHGVEGRRYSANGPADRQSKEGTSSSGSTRSRNARSTKVVRSRAVADRQRTPVAAADGISRRLPQQAAANASAPSQGVAKRTGERIAVSSALTPLATRADGSARPSGVWREQARFVKRQLSLPVSRRSQ